MKEDRLTSMLHFVRIVETGSLSQAARAVGKSLPAISRSLRTLEERLGTRLLTRTTRAIALTEFGQQYFEHCRRILRDIDEAENLASATGKIVQGQIRISAPLFFGRLHIAPLIAPFLLSYPRVQIDLLLNDAIVNMIDDGIDLSIRIGELQDSSLVAIPLGHVARVVCATPRYWKQHGKPQLPNDLKSHQCIAFRGLGQERGWLFQQNGEEKLWPIQPVHISNDGAAVLTVARDHGGVVQMMTYQVADDLQHKKLVSVLEQFSPRGLPVHIVYPTGKLLPAKVRAILDEWVPKLRQKLAAT